MMLKLFKFRKEDVFHINLAFDFPPDLRQTMVEHKDVTGYTLYQDKDILCIGGIHGLWNGVGEAWFLIGKEGYDNPKSVAKHTFFMFEHLQQEYGFIRVQASVAKKDRKAIRFVEWLGFKNEGIMEKYGPDGLDYYRYAKVL